MPQSIKVDNPVCNYLLLINLESNWKVTSFLESSSVFLHQRHEDLPLSLRCFRGWNREMILRVAGITLIVVFSGETAASTLVRLPLSAPLKLLKLSPFLTKSRAKYFFKIKKKIKCRNKCNVWENCLDSFLTFNWTTSSTLLWQMEISLKFLTKSDHSIQNSPSLRTLPWLRRKQPT